MELDWIETNDVSSLLPPEIWVKIFKFSRNLSKLRLVCKNWQAIIDELVDMKVRIHDDRMDVTSTYKFKRVVQCTIYKFLGHDKSSNQLFLASKLLKSVSLRGAITRPNFLLLATQCGNVKELNLSGTLLALSGNIFDTGSNVEETNILTKFMSELEQLVLNALHIKLFENNSTSVNFQKLLSWPMNQLKTLVVCINFGDTETVRQFFKMLKKFGSLENIEFTSRSHLTTLVNGENGFVLPNLSSLKVEMVDEHCLRMWLPFIKAQNSIKYLKFVTPAETFCFDQDFREAIMKNSKTLQEIEIGRLRHGGWPVNLEFLQEFDNLASLVFRGDGQGEQNPMLENINFLPESLEVLVLDNVVVKRTEFEGIAARIANLETESVDFH